VEPQGYRSTEEPPTSDRVLVQQAHAGDQHAFEALIRRYQPALFGLISHYVGDCHEAQDILQQFWLQLYLSLDTLRPHVSIKAWLITVARNRSLDTLRHKRLPSFSEVVTGHEEYGAVSIDEIPDTSPTPEELAERRDLQQAVRRAIQTLSQAYRLIVLLHAGEYLTFSEIGQILHVPKATVKTRFNRAKPLLRDVFTAHYACSGVRQHRDKAQRANARDYTVKDARRGQGELW
jgi:RNA polymerase sigma factor (sigma-70 family)